MKDLLEQDFSAFFDKVHKRHPVADIQVKEDVSFCDKKACDSCRPFFIANCEHEVFLLHSTAAVNYVNIEDYLDTFEHVEGDRCDGLLYDADKIVLFDMYCGMSDYLDVHLIDGKPVKGKKTKVKEQIEATLSLLNSIPAIASYINQHKEKFAIFAYRIPYDEIFLSAPRVVQISGNKMLSMAKMIQNRKLSLPMACNFKYIAVKYPERYKW